jgi:hypothetical protein
MKNLISRIISLTFQACFIVFPFAFTVAVWQESDNKAGCIAALCLLWGGYILFISVARSAAKGILAAVESARRKEGQP